MADIILPDPGEGFEYIKVSRPKERLVALREERDVLKAELDLMENPPNSELIELGKNFHPYFIKERELDNIKNLIKDITG